MKQFINISVAYALPERQPVIELQVPEGTTLLAAVKLSGIAEYFPELDFNTVPMGIFGQPIANQNKATTRLKSNDRIELYRPLINLPEYARLKRAKTTS